MAKKLTATEKQIKKELEEKRKELKAIQQKIKEAEGLDGLYEEQEDISNDIDVLESKLENARFIVPAKGKFIAYKKIYAVGDDTNHHHELIATLEVPAKALRMTATDECNVDSGGEFKSRVSEAKVLSIVCVNRGTKLKVGQSRYDNSFKYHVGKIVKPRRKFTKADKVCASGIHCFMEKKTAVYYS